MFTKTQDDKFDKFQFLAGGYEFYVIYSRKNGYWSVLRQEKGAQLKTWGKTFWRAADMVQHYKTASDILAQIAAECKPA